MRNETLVLGATLKTNRYANVAMRRLIAHGITVRAIGLQESDFKGIHIDVGCPNFKNIDTVTVYLNAKNQENYWEYLIKLNPRRVLFNPGSENPPLRSFLEKSGILVEEACTLVLISTGQY